MSKRRRQAISLKPIVTLLLLGATFGILFYIPPSNIFIILGYVILIAACAFIVSAHFTKNKSTHILASLFIAAFLLSNLIAGFNLLNTLLLLSFIIGVRLLFR